jgi:AcrR family transcriptional regulator
MTKRRQTGQKPRRRPIQSRSQQTSLAIQDAFVRLLDEQPYARVTIREIVLVAGVGLGTFYDYFDSKDDLARTCVHLRTKALLQALRRRRIELAGRPLDESLAGAIDSQLAMIGRAPREWAQHFLLERQKTDLKYYLAAYELFVEEWRKLVAGAADWPADVDPELPVRLVFTLIYGTMAHELMRTGARIDIARLRRELCDAALACLAPHAARASI